ncbi:MAG: aldo/keto reductase [Sedimentisphaerales bacterium]|nr:aldo/keto reductase [Sedimentisphaerales bacterium]
MIYKEYGKTGLKVSAVGFGGMQFDTEKDPQVNAQLLQYAWDRGINFFDTAPKYCKDQSEEIFGLAMQQMKSVRDKFYVCSKSMPTEQDTADKARQAVEKSLQRLHLDKLDFFYIWCIRKMQHYELAMAPGGQYQGLLMCKEQGLIDHIVLSTHLQGNAIEQILREQKVEGILAGINILNFPYRWQGVKTAYEMGYGVVAMNPLAGGLIPKNESELTFLAQKGESPTDAALRFCISCPQIAVTLNGFTTEQHIDQACAVADKCKPFRQTDIDRISNNLSHQMNEICTGCGYCLKDCPQNIPIAAYMQFYNDILLFGKSDEQMINAIDRHHNWGILVERPAEAADCTQCGNCQEACTQHLNIIDRLKEIAAWEKVAQENKNQKK